MALRVLFVEPFCGGSHRAFAEGLAAHSAHDITLLTLPGSEWRKRMRRGAQELAQRAVELPGHFDLIIATDMLDLAAFLALTRARFAATPVLYYLHENQFTYPRLRGTRLNSWFGQVNYLAALVAGTVAFNSDYHRQDFLGALAALRSQPNNWLLDEAVDAIAAKSSVLPVGVDLAWLDDERVRRTKPPLVLWNARWEFDKAPETFVRVLTRLAGSGLDFRVAVAGERGDNPSPALLALPGVMGERLAHFGFLPSREGYGRLLARASVVVSTARHEFFGVGMVEAMYAGCVPVAPANYNYPALVPDALHERCLWEDEAGLESRLVALLRPGAVTPADRGLVRASAARFAWPVVAPLWDAAIESAVLSSQPSAPRGPAPG